MREGTEKEKETENERERGGEKKKAQRDHVKEHEWGGRGTKRETD